MNLEHLKNKQLYKFTGPPENWLTAIKFMTWGLEIKYKETWKNILPGDIFLMHSTSTNTRVKGARSAIIGFGVVGNSPTVKSYPLWLQEFEKRVNRWPLLVPFSEIYLFSSFFQRNKVPQPTLTNTNDVTRASLEILNDSIPLSSVSGFPQMGSISSVRSEVVAQIFNKVNRMYVIGSKSTGKDYVPTPLMKLDSIKEVNRYATSLQTLSEVKTKTFTAKDSNYSKDFVSLERAESAHQATVQKLKDLFDRAGYETLYNKHIDLFAVKNDKSFLFEVKSNENKNFLPQARKGIVQLFEYGYFEVNKFQEERNIELLTTYKNLTFSQKPANEEYAKFMNSLELGVSYFNNQKLETIGRSFGVQNI